ncbi:MAG: hypothetical protein GY772_18845 [bacterium]|nr:hypothetical protein [bacterium]MDP7572565.1 hypothetical protein [Myxococcota bacterium]
MRCGIAFAFFFLCEAVGILASFGLWLRDGHGTAREREVRVRPDRGAIPCCATAHSARRTVGAER